MMKNYIMYEMLKKIINFFNFQKKPSSITNNNYRKMQNSAIDDELLKAIEVNDLSKAEECLHNGANANVRNNDNHSALMVAAFEPHPEMLKLLLDFGADVNMVGPADTTALFRAIDSENLDCVNLLLLHGANVNAKANLFCRQDNPLYHALSIYIKDDVEMLAIIHSLLKAGADIHAVDENGKSVLDVAGAHDLTLLKLLISYGADIKQNHTLLLDIVGNNYSLPKPERLSIVRFLLNHKSPINARNKHGHTILMKAILSNNYDFEIIRELLRSGADATLKNPKGETAYTLAHRHKNNEVMQLLNENFIARYQIVRYQQSNPVKKNKTMTSVALSDNSLFKHLEHTKREMNSINSLRMG